MTRSDSPIANRDRVVSIFRRDAHREAGPLSYQDYRSVKSRDDAFEWIGAARILPSTVIIAGESQVMSVARVTPAVARFLNLSFKEGVVISHRVWENQFRSEPSVFSEKILIGDRNLSVAGIAPDGLEGLYSDRGVDLWAPLDEEALQGVDPNGRNFWVLAQRRANYSISGVAEMRVVPYTGTTPDVAEGRSRVGALLTFAAALVFFIACANVAAFLVGRASERSLETSTRVALGASRGQLVRGLLSDSVVISVTGGALGMLLALWTSLVLPTLLFEEDAKQLVFAPDVFSIVAACLGCVAIIIICGLLPVLVISTDQPATVLRRESAGPSIGIQRLRMCLVVAQMASCCVLVISTTFLFAGLRSARQPSDSGQRASGFRNRRRPEVLPKCPACGAVGGWGFGEVVDGAAAGRS